MQFIHRIPVCLVVLAVLSLGFAFSANAANLKNKEQFVRGLGDEVIKTAKDSVLSKSQKEQRLAELFSQYVDTDFMGKFALGRHYRTISSDEQKKFLQLYRQFMISTYIPKFEEYIGNGFEITKVRDDKDGIFVVETKLFATKDRPEAKVEYKLKDQAGTYKIVDIIGEGVSLITTQRADFGGVIDQKGIQHFMNRLSSRVQSSSLARSSS